MTPSTVPIDLPLIPDPLAADSPSHDAPAAPKNRDSMLLITAGIVLLCIVLGAVVLPYLLVGPFERITGIDSASASNLRPLGAIIGLFTGVTLALVAGAVTWTSRAMR